MKKRVLSILLAVVMIVGMIPAAALTAFAENDAIELQSSTNGQTIGAAGETTYYCVTSDTSCTATTAGVSGISIVDYAVVHIFVPAGVTLTAKGGNAEGTIGGGAGILVPEHATLYLEGEGTVNATGGNAADGTRGEQGEPGKITVDNTDVGGIIIKEGGSYYGGKGGDGGNGGGGAGAGIGTAGGNGGNGGQGGHGDGGDINKNHLNFEIGHDGENGQYAEQKGVLHTQPTLKLNAAGGTFGRGEEGADYGPNRQDTDFNSHWDYNHTAGGGSGGAGGQGGGAAASVGNGGQGGAGGGGGSGAGAIYREDSGYYDILTWGGECPTAAPGADPATIDIWAGGSLTSTYGSGTIVGYWSGYPYYPDGTPGGKGGVGGASSVHVHDFSETVCECGKQEFMIDEDGVLYEYNGDDEYIVIPEGVKTIGKNVFRDYPLEGVFIPSTVEVIESYAFYGTPLSEINIPASVTVIGSRAFRNCTSLTDIVFASDSTLKTIDAYAFCNTALKSISIPASVEKMSDHVFIDCTNLLVVGANWMDPNAVDVHPLSFSGIKSLCKLYVPVGTKSVYQANYAFDYFTDIVEYEYTDDLHLITSETTELTNGVWLSDGETTFDETLYVNGSVTLYLKDNSLLTANKGIVLKNASVLNIVAESNGENMGKIVAFGSGNGAGIGGSVTLSNNLDINIYGGDIKATGYYGNAAIGAGRNNKNVTVTIFGGIVDADGGVAYNSGIGSGQGSTGCRVIIYDGTVTAKGATNDGGAGIGGAYNGDCGIVEIYGGDITAIGGGKAAGIGRAGMISKNEGSVTIGGGHIAAIGGNTTGGKADAIKSRTVIASPEEDEKIWLCTADGTAVGASPFVEETDITNAVAGVSELYKHIFKQGNTYGICSCGAEGEFVIEDGVLIRYNGDAESITIPDEVTAIGGYVFADNSSIRYVSMPNVTSVDSMAFYACKTISEVNMPNVISIGTAAFHDCSNLSRVIMPKITTITRGAFDSCPELSTVEMPNVKSIGHKAFYNCIRLDNAVMPNVEYVGNEAFYGCTNLDKITVSDKMTVGSDSFAQCDIRDVYYPCTSNVETIKATLKLKCKYIPIHNYADGICACGAKVLDFDSISLVLSGELGLHFYTVVNDVETVKDGYMLYEIGSKGETQIVNFSDAVLCDDGRYIFRCNVNALQMSDTITVSFHYDDTLVGPKTTSVASYIDKLIEKHNNDDTDPTVKLAKSIFNYGHYAQIALSELHGFTLGTDYTVTNNKNDVTIANAADIEAYKATKTGNIDGITKVSRSLSLDHGTNINIYLTVKDEYVPNVNVTDKNGNAVEFTLEKIKDGRYLLVIPQIAAHQLGDMYTVSVDDGAMTMSVSALSYAYSVLNSDKSDAQKLTVSALYEYYKAAIAYRNAQ